MPKYLYTFESMASAGNYVTTRTAETVSIQIKGNLIVEDPSDANLQSVYQRHFVKTDGREKTDAEQKETWLRDANDAQAAEKLSSQAREALINTAAKQGAIAVPEHLDSHLARMFRDESISNNSENKAYNRKLLEAVEKDDLPTQRQMYEEYLQGLPPFNFNALGDMTDETLIANTPDLYSLYLAATEAAKLYQDSSPENFASTLSPDAQKKVAQLALDLPLLEAMKNRLELLASPYYPRIDPNKLLQKENATQSLDAVLGGRGMLPGFAGYCKHARAFLHTPDFTDLLPARRLGTTLLEAGFDLQSLRIYDLNNREHSLLDMHRTGGAEALRNGMPLIFRDARGNMATYRQENGNLTPVDPRPLISSRLNETLTTRLADLTALATGSVADPFWMISGSGEYRDIKNALTEHAKVVKSIGNPPREESLQVLRDSLEHLSGAARHYLSLKDPAINDNISYEAYIRQKGNSLKMNERELTRLKAAFDARDLALDTRGTVAASRTIGMKNKADLTVDQAFYQGLLRKYEALQTQKEALFTSAANSSDNTLLENLNTIILDTEMYDSNVRPKDADATRTLFWEMRQTRDLIGRAEQALGLQSNPQIPDNQASIKASTENFFGSTNPADLPVESLRDTLNNALQNAEQRRAEEARQRQASNQKGPRRLDYSPNEFYWDKMILESEIAESNDPAAIRKYMAQNAGKLSSSAKKFLTHRSKCMDRFEELERNPTGRQPLESYTITRDGVELTEQPAPDQLQPNDLIMLKGVHERRSQSTLNGCWSVSLCSQLEYRGVELAQEEIRAYRPNQQEFKTSTETLTYYKNEKQCISEYSALIGKVLPNTQLVHFGALGNKNKPELLRTVVRHALTVDNSPVSICAGGHYLTIVGMQGDTFYVKNPLHIFGGNPEKLEKWTVDDIMKRGRGEFEVNWLRDVTPTLGGNGKTKVMHNQGLTYCNGEAFPGEVSPLNTDENLRVLLESDTITYAGVNGEPLAIALKVDCPRYLQYKRLPGSGYNADALSALSNELRGLFPDGTAMPAEVQSVLQEADRLQNGAYATAPNKGMLNLARQYLTALVNCKNAPDVPPNLEGVLTRHLKDVRTAVVEMQQSKYKLLMGESDHFITNSNTPTASALHKGRYRNVIKGCSGMLYLHSMAQADLTDEKWISGLSDKSVASGAKQLEQSPALQRTVDEIYDDANQYSMLLDKSTGLLYKKAGVIESKAEAEKRKAEEAKAAAEAAKKSPKVKTPAKQRFDEALNTFETAISQRAASESLKAQHQFLEKHNLDLATYGKKNKTDREVQTLLDATFDFRMGRNFRLAIRSGDTTDLFRRYALQLNNLQKEAAEQENLNIPTLTDSMKKDLSAFKGALQAPASSKAAPRQNIPKLTEDMQIDLAKIKEGPAKKLPLLKINDVPVLKQEMKDHITEQKDILEKPKSSQNQKTQTNGLIK